MSLRFLILVCFFFSVSNAWVFTDWKCVPKKDCVSCAGTVGWTGKRCRWCYRTSSCHGYGSLVVKCSPLEHVENPANCKKIVHAKYDKNLAYKLVFLSALAYSPDVAKYISGASEVNTFHLVTQVIKSCSGGALCSGFVAVSHLRKAIAIAFSGTENFEQLITEMRRIPDEPVHVQAYFDKPFQVVWRDLEHHVNEQIKKYPNYKVWVTGHSFGGALASLASTAIAVAQKTPKGNLVLYTFGQPRVGNNNYASAHDRLVPQSFRLTHYRDIAVHLPICRRDPGGPCLSFGGGPYHHGKEIFYENKVMTTDSPYKICDGFPYNEDVRCSENPFVWSKCFSTELSKCIDDHQYYFGIPVGTWWKNVQI